MTAIFMISIVLVSVPLWGLFNLTIWTWQFELNDLLTTVSVPLWGLFNLTLIKSY